MNLTSSAEHKHNTSSLSLDVPIFDKSAPVEWAVIFVFMLSFCLLFYNIGSGSLYAWDEAWYAEIAREIVQDGLGWMTLHFNYEPWFHKPPLFIWAIALSFKIFGINEFAVRLPSGVLAFGCTVITYLLTKELFKSKILAALSVLVLLCYRQFTIHGRLGMLDAPITFFILTSVYFYILAKNNSRYYLCVGLSAGICFMIKSFAAIQIPIILFCYEAARHNLKSLMNKHLIIGFIMGLLMIAPWHIYQFMHNRDQFIQEYIYFNFISRTFAQFEHQQPFYYYIKIIIEKNLPLGLLGIASFFWCLNRQIKNLTNPFKYEIILILCSITAIVVSFSISRSKLPWYIYPAYPFFSILTAYSSIVIINNLVKTKAIIYTFFAYLMILSIIVSTSKSLRNPDYSKELKYISLLASQHTSKNETLYYSGISEFTVINFYSERKISPFAINQDSLPSPPKCCHRCLISRETYRRLLGAPGQKIRILQESLSYLLLECQYKENL